MALFQQPARLKRTTCKEAEHPGEGDVILLVGIYVAEDMGWALPEPEECTKLFYDRICQGLIQTSVSYDGDLCAQQAQRLASMT